VVFQQWRKSEELWNNGVLVMRKWRKFVDNGVSAMGKMVKGC
jgi:hypothetical protein